MEFFIFGLLFVLAVFVGAAAINWIDRVDQRKHADRLQKLLEEHRKEMEERYK